MPPSEPIASPRRPIDWRGWLILAWVVWFGMLYGTMVVEQRGGKLRELVLRITARAGVSR